MMQLARERKIDCVVVTRLDRLGRSLSNLLALLGELEELGVEFVAIEDGVDTSTSVGRLFLQIRGAFAEYERALITERTEEGRVAARKRGVRFGRPRRIDERHRDRIGRLRASGHTIRAIAQTIGVSKSVVARELRAQLACPETPSVDHRVVRV